MARTIESPGIQINEIDLSNITNLPVGTNIFIQGFAAQGPTHEAVNITSVSEFESIYGMPTNAAERYAFTSVKQVLNSPGRAIFNRLPYGESDGAGTGNNYTALAFPYVVVPSVSSTTEASLSSIVWTGASSYDITINQEDQWQGIVVGAPELITLELSAFEALKDGDITTASGGTSSWNTTFSTTTVNTITSRGDMYKSLFIITNDRKTSVELDYSGYYLAVTDNTDLLDQEYDKVKSVRSRSNNGDYTIPTDSLTFNLTSAGSIFSASETIETGLGFNFDQTSYDDMLQLTVSRLRPDWFNSTGGGSRAQLNQVFVESLPGSFDRTRVGTELTPYNPQPGTVFIDTVLDRYSQGYITQKTNPIIAANFAGKTIRMAGAGLTTEAALSGVGFDMSEFTDDQVTAITTAVGALGTTDKMFAIGEYEPCTDSDNKIIGAVPSKLDRGFALVENRDLWPLDIVIDAGMSTINVVSEEIANDRAGVEFNGADIFDDTVSINIDDLKSPTPATATASTVYASWQAVYNSLQTFCGETRKDCMFIVDPLRNIFVQGEDARTINKTSASFSRDILTPLRNLVSATNSNYGATYATWAKAYDSNTDTFFWAPFSGFQAAIMARLDSTGQPWFAPAGLNNGIVRNIIDLAIAPNQKERDLLYRYSINAVANFPRDGFVVFGQKTLQAKPSAFDRINVRRLFLTLEKATRRVARYFVFEPNTIFTRTRLVNVLKPIFEIAKNNQGVYDYLIVCDERNNTPDVIDRNELVVDIYIKPVRTAEFILINFIATRTGDDFSELIGG